MDELPDLEPLKVRCTDTKCDEGLHCFRPNFRKKKWKQDYKGACNECGATLEPWNPVKRRDIADISSIFVDLRAEFIRHEFFHRPFDRVALKDAAQRGPSGLRARIRKELKNGIGAAKPWRDGNQTPMVDNAINYARHATATCCRKCLEYWYNIRVGIPWWTANSISVRRWCRAISMSEPASCGPRSKRLEHSPMPATALIDTQAQAERMRARIIRPEAGEVLIARMVGSDQERDLTEPANCEGLGRIRHFRRNTAEGWPSNPLPIDAAAFSLGIPSGDILRAQVFQNAACAWRCWYCYVPFELLGGHERSADWVTARRLVELYASQTDRPSVLDLSGGSPDLTPEWILWTMDALEAAGLAEDVYLWSDDNLSTDYLFTKLSAAERERLVRYQHYGRVCCFKGFDTASFAYNTGADDSAFDRQFDLFARYLSLGIDLYAYVTLTGPSIEAVEDSMPRFIDRLQAISSALPLRVIPLQIGPFGPMLTRPKAETRGSALTVQEHAITAWNAALTERFSVAERAMPIAQVRL